MAKKKAPEAAMMANCSAFLERITEGRIHNEVQLHDGKATADAVLESHRSGEPKAFVFEGKSNMASVVLRQAHYWTKYADGVSIVLPKPKGKGKTLRTNIDERAKYWPLLDEIGVGLIEVDGTSVSVMLNPRIAQDNRSAALLAKLDPKLAKVAQAGSAGGAVASKWGLTRQRLVAEAKAYPGTPLKLLVKQIEHHYGSNREAITKLSHMLRKGSGIPGLRYDGDQTLVYPSD